MNVKRLLPLLGLALLVWGMASGFAPRDPDSAMRISVQGKGDIVIRLYTKQAPKATAHIVELVRNGFYNGQRFYRVDKSPRPYLVQLGAPGSRNKSMDDKSLAEEGTGARIPFEDSGYSNDSAGVVGLSTKSGDKNSGDAQFYILLAPARFLDGNYTIFGKVVEGMGVLQSLTKGDTVTSVSLGS